MRGGGVDHLYSYGAGLLHDSAGDTVYTPGVSQRKSGVDGYFHQDWIGSTRYLTDAAGLGAPTAYRFDGYGVPSAGAGPDTTAVKFAGAHGYRSDAPAGLQLLGARYYDPAAGRFLSPDPIGFAGGLNLYAYTDNDPVNSVDPTGLKGRRGVWHWLWSKVSALWETRLDPDTPTFQDSPLPHVRRAGKGIDQFIDDLGAEATKQAAFTALGAVVGRAVGAATQAATVGVGCSRTLARNMRLAGIRRPWWTSPHHIVAGNDHRAAVSRTILQKYGIDINDAANGVFLPRTRFSKAPGYHHPSVHTGAYYEEVERRLLTTTTQPEALAALRGIAAELLARTFPIR